MFTCITKLSLGTCKHLWAHLSRDKSLSGCTVNSKKQPECLNRNKNVNNDGIYDMWELFFLHLLFHFSITSIYYHNTAFLKTLGKWLNFIVTPHIWLLPALCHWCCGWAGFWLANVYLRLGVDVDRNILKYHQCLDRFLFFLNGSQKNMFLNVHTYVWA